MSKSPSLRRIQADIRELSMDPSDRYHAFPLENDMFEWHFTIRGADGTDFEGGYYHGRILLPAEYPFKPPNIVFLTPSGRFETNTKVCLSFSAYHPELWQPAWGIRLILEALVSFLPTKGDGAIGALDWTSDERKRLAKKSVDFICPACGKCSDILKRIEKKIASGGGKGTKGGKSMFQKEIEQLHAMQMANHDEEVEKDEVANEIEGAEETVEEKNEEQVVKEGKQDIPVPVNDSCEKSVKEDVVNDVSGEDNSTLEAPVEEEEAVNQELKQESESLNTALEQVQVPQIIEEESQGQTGESDCQEEVIVDDDQQGRERLESPLLSDPVIHTGIVVFSVIVWLLFRKLTAVIEDMRALEAEIRELR